MKIEEFLKCDHDIEPNTAMTAMRCDKCLVDANVIRIVETQRKQLDTAIEALEKYRGCTAIHNEKFNDWCKRNPNGVTGNLLVWGKADFASPALQKIKELNGGAWL